MTITNTNFCKIFLFSIVYIANFNRYASQEVESTIKTIINNNVTVDSNIDTTTAFIDNIEDDIEDVEQLFGMLNTTNNDYNESLTTVTSIINDDDNNTTFDDIENLLTEDFDTTLNVIDTTSTTHLPKILSEDFNDNQMTTNDDNLINEELTTKLQEITTTVTTINYDQLAEESLEQMLEVIKERESKQIVHSILENSTEKLNEVNRDVIAEEDGGDTEERREEIDSTTNSIPITQELTTQITTTSSNFLSNETTQSDVILEYVTNVFKEDSSNSTNNYVDITTVAEQTQETTTQDVEETSEIDDDTSQSTITTNFLTSTITNEIETDVPTTENGLDENAFTLINMENNGKMYLDKGGNKDDSEEKEGKSTEDYEESSQITTEANKIEESTEKQQENDHQSINEDDLLDTTTQINEVDNANVTDIPETTTTTVEEENEKEQDEKKDERQQQEDEIEDIINITEETQTDAILTTLPNEGEITEMEIMTELNAIEEVITTTHDELPTTIKYEYEETTQTNKLTKGDNVEDLKQSKERIGKMYETTDPAIDSIPTTTVIVDTTQSLEEMYVTTANDDAKEITTTSPNEDNSILDEITSINNTSVTDEFETEIENEEMDSTTLDFVTENVIKESDYEAATISHDGNYPRTEFDMEDYFKSIPLLNTPASKKEEDDGSRIVLFNNIHMDVTTTRSGDNLNTESETIQSVYETKEESHIPLTRQFARKLIPLVEQDDLQVNLNTMESTSKVPIKKIFITSAEDVGDDDDDEMEDGIYKEILDKLETERNDFEITIPINSDTNVERILEHETDKKTIIEDDESEDTGFDEEFNNEEARFYKNYTELDDYSNDFKLSKFISNTFDMYNEITMWINATYNLYYEGKRFKLQSNATFTSNEYNSKDAVVTTTWQFYKDNTLQFHNVTFTVIFTKQTFNIDTFSFVLKRNGSIVLDGSRLINDTRVDFGVYYEMVSYDINFRHYTLDVEKLTVLCTKHAKRNDTYPTEKLFVAQNLLLIEIIGISTGCLLLLIVLFIYIYKRYTSNVLKITLD